MHALPVLSHPLVVIPLYTGVLVGSFIIIEIYTEIFFCNLLHTILLTKKYQSVSFFERAIESSNLSNYDQLRRFYETSSIERLNRRYYVIMLNLTEFLLQLYLKWF